MWAKIINDCPIRVNIKDSSVQKLASVCRRIYRIFSHAYFHHRPIYDEFEVANLNHCHLISWIYAIKILYLKKETSLCQRFTKFVIKYDLMTSDTLIVPVKENNDADSEKKSNESEAWNYFILYFMISVGILEFFIQIFILYYY